MYLESTFLLVPKAFQVGPEISTTYVLGENERLVVDTQGLRSSLCWSLVVLERLLHSDTLGPLPGQFPTLSSTFGLAKTCQTCWDPTPTCVLVFTLDFLSFVPFSCVLYLSLEP